ncbi:MAG: ribosome-associated translation inhibitor RaiA, partial [Candidatus Margulisbacteria bacterium]|nr:ribosome-associated translation inhibitor RaiA [Candidatus Margulisiibacteriota bacterium]
MKINVRTHGVDLSAPLKEYTEKKMEKLSRFYDNIQEIVVELHLTENADNSQRQQAMATLWASGTILRA